MSWRDTLENMEDACVEQEYRDSRLPYFIIASTKAICLAIEHEGKETRERLNYLQGLP